MIGPLTQELLDQVLKEIKKDENQVKLKNGIVDPMIQYLHTLVYNYLQFLGILMGMIIFLLVLILFLVWKRKS
tara:strand:+ start:256 stop:474 length:219 start_codon:yes stop_codon:yes gene_type:complete